MNCVTSWGKPSSLWATLIGHKCHNSPFTILPESTWTQHLSLPPSTCCSARAHQPHDVALSNVVARRRGWTMNGSLSCSVGGTWSCAGVIGVAMCRLWPSFGGTDRSSAFTVRVSSSSCTEHKVKVSCSALQVSRFESGHCFILLLCRSVIRDRNASPGWRHECQPHSLMSGKLTGWGGPAVSPCRALNNIWLVKYENNTREHAGGLERWWFPQALSVI